MHFLYRLSERAAILKFIGLIVADRSHTPHTIVQPHTSSSLLFEIGFRMQSQTPHLAAFFVGTILRAYTWKIGIISHTLD
jgi:hypothetical protein